MSKSQLQFFVLFVAAVTVSYFTVALFDTLVLKIIIALASVLPSIPFGYRLWAKQPDNEARKQLDSFRELGANMLFGWAVVAVCYVLTTGQNVRIVRAIEFIELVCLACPMVASLRFFFRKAAKEVGN